MVLSRNTVDIFVAAAMLLATVASAHTDEQEKEEEKKLASNFSELQTWVSPGDKVIVTDTSGRSSKGDIEEISESTSDLSLRVGGDLIRIHQDDVEKIELIFSDSLFKGPLIGGLIGAALVAIPCAGQQCDSNAVSAGVLAIGVGAGIGLAIDALIKDKRLVYSAPEGGSTTPQITALPILTRERKGILVSIRF